MSLLPCVSARPAYPVRGNVFSAETNKSSVMQHDQVISIEPAMAGVPVLASNGTDGRRITMPRALAELQYNSIITSDLATSSEDDETPEAQQILADDARSVVGVSIGQAQSRLTSPKTPAAEKAAAIAGAGGFFGDTHTTLAEEPEDEEDDAELDGVNEKRDASVAASAARPTARSPNTTSPRKAQVRLPSPWRSGPKQFQRVDLRGDFRRRASSGPDLSWRESLMSSLPSLPKHFSISSPFSSSHEKTGDQVDGDQKSRSKRSSTYFNAPSFNWPSFSGESNEPSQSSTPRKRSGSENHTTPESSSQSTSPLVKRSSRESEEGHATVAPLPTRPAMQPTRSRAPGLRRSTSDNSLITQRTLSRVSSLGDDTRFENVSEQVNSRMKAIRDSWQDSNIKLPSMPNISHFNLSSFKPDFSYARSGSVPRKPSVRDAADRSPSARPANGGKSERPSDPMTRQPYSSAKAAVLDTAAFDISSNHPHFKKAIAELTGDVVILGGYRGSILRSAEYPHRQVWVPVKVGLNIRKVNLEVGISPGDDERAVDNVIPGGMLSHIGPVDISRRLFRRLRASENGRTGKMRIHDYGYDWRLDPNLLSKRLIEFIEKLACNAPGVDPEKRGAIVIAHSLGGLITRHAINQRPELFRGVVYAGVPSTCVNILGPLRNGDEVLLSSRVLTAQVNFTIRTSFALLPLDGRCFFDKETKKEYHVDFFDPKTWLDYRLSPCVARPLPPLYTPPNTGGLTGFVSSMASALPSLSVPGRKSSVSRSKSPSNTATAINAGDVAEPGTMGSSPFNGGNEAVEKGNIDTSRQGTDPTGQLESATIPQAEGSSTHPASSVATTVTISQEDAMAYLERTLASVKKFKEELAFRPPHAAANMYPPAAVIYGKSTPTVYGAKVSGREGIKHADAYDNLAFASGDGVVLARAAMVPEGYSVVKKGVISSERGHVTLLGDLEAVGRCLGAIMEARRKGVGAGR